MIPSAREAKRDALLVAVFTILISLPWLGGAWHVDEPFFIAVARQIQVRPLKPYGFLFFSLGRWVPMESLNNSPPLLPYLLAAAWSLTGGAEFWTRLLFLPFDVAAALGIYFLAARFLKKPLLPALILAAGPAQVLNLGHLMTEKPMAAFSFAALALIVRAVDERDDRRWAAGWALFGLALLSKYAAVFLLVPAAAYALAAGVPPRRVGIALLGAVSGLALWLAARALGGGAPVSAAWRVLSAAGAGGAGSPVHRIRAWLAFLGGLAPAALVLCALLRPRARTVAVGAAAALLLFLPALDAGAATSPSDRWLGIAMASSALLALWSVWRGERPRLSRVLWCSWIAAALLFQVFVYWSVMARLVLFALPPVILALCESVERRAGGLPRPVALLALALTVALTAALGTADRAFADGEKSFIADAVRLRPRETLFCGGSWGLQFYAEQAGIRAMEKTAPAWAALTPGDTVFAGRMDAASLRPPAGLSLRADTLGIPSGVPLRLIGAWTGEAAFYSSAMGFLPWSVSREPLETITLIQRLPGAAASPRRR